MFWNKGCWLWTCWRPFRSDTWVVRETSWEEVDYIFHSPSNFLMNPIRWADCLHFERFIGYHFNPVVIQQQEEEKNRKKGENVVSIVHLLWIFWYCTFTVLYLVLVFVNFLIIDMIQRTTKLNRWNEKWPWKCRLIKN